LAKLRAGAWLTAAAVLGLVALLLVIEAAVFAITAFGIAPYWSCLIVAAVLGVAAAVFAAMGWVPANAGPRGKGTAKRMRALFVISPLIAVSAWTTARADPLAPVDAAGHVGQVATVCGLVASTKYAPQSFGAPTFLDFGSAYPNAVFTALILGGDRAKFGAPERTLGGKQVCVTGQVRLYSGTPQVILTQPDQLNEKGSAGRVGRVPDDGVAGR
jgi:hypothetical protein